MSTRTVMMHDELIEGVNYFPHENLTAGGWREPGFGRAISSISTRDQFEVVPAGGSQTERSRAARAKLELYALAAMAQSRKAHASRQTMRTADRRTVSARNDLDRLEDAIRQLSAPSVDQMAAQMGQGYMERGARMCAEAKAAYDARNPHKKREG